jgi:AcrR family transcriptional regulator
MEKKNINKRKLKAIETKNKIYEAARKLSLEHGIEKVSVDTIVEAAGVSKGAFYVHFESKDALTAELVDEYTNKADIDYKAFLNSLPDNMPILDILVLLAEEICDFIVTNIGLENMRVLYKAHLTKTINTSSAMSYNRELYNLFTEVLEKGLMRGEIRQDIPVNNMAKHLVLAIRGITYEWCIRYPDIDLKEYVLDHFKILLYGLES